MSWLSQNWIWILLGLGALFLFGRGRHHGSGLGHHGYGGYGRGDGESGSMQMGSAGSEMPGGDRSQHPGQPGLAIDPVTREDVSTDKALTSIYQGRIYYFASAENRQRFEASPAQFAREGLGHSVGPAEGSEQRRPRRRGGC